MSFYALTPLIELTHLIGWILGEEDKDIISYEALDSDITSHLLLFNQGPCWKFTSQDQEAYFDEAACEEINNFVESDDQEHTMEFLNKEYKLTMTE